MTEYAICASQDAKTGKAQHCRTRMRKSMQILLSFSNLLADGKVWTDLLAMDVNRCWLFDLEKRWNVLICLDRFNCSAEGLIGVCYSWCPFGMVAKMSKRKRILQ